MKTTNDTTGADQTVGRFSTIANDLRRAADKADELAGPATEIPHMPPSDTGPLRDDIRDLADVVSDAAGRIRNESRTPGREAD